MKRRMTALLSLFLALCLSLAGCGGREEGPTAAETEMPAQAQADADTEPADQPEDEPEMVPAAMDPDALYINDGTVEGLYQLYEITGVSLAEYAELAEISLREAARLIEVELSEDGSARFAAEGEWTDVAFRRTGDAVEIEAEGETVSGTLKDGLLTLDMDGVEVILARLTDKALEEPEMDHGEGVTEETSSLAASEASAESDTPAPAGTASGEDGYVSEEKLLKAYVWLSEVVTNEFDLTYEDIVAYFGVEGQFEREEYSEHMKRNYRYYKWISEENDLDFIYFNFEENEDGSYTLSAFNTNHFSGTDAVAKYLDEVKAEAAEADRAAAATMEMKTITRDIYRAGTGPNSTSKLGNTGPVTLEMEMPASGWSYNEDRDQLVDNEDPTAFGAGFIQFKVDRDMAAIDFYKDSYENFKEIGEREIGGITFQGRTYKNIGYEWETYVAEMPDGRGFSIGIVGLDTSDGTVASRILDSIRFK